MALDAKRLRAIIGGSAGNLVEWYDWYAYTSLSLYFAATFFPKGDATAQLLGTSAVFAVGFLMRPIGAYIMGRYADTHGRKAGLALSVGLMCAGSLMIACVPGYATIGIAAPIILILARMIQGLSVGGEYGASATYLSEMATRKNRGFWSSFQYFTLIGGQLTSLAVTLILQASLTKPQMESFGWRIAFVLGAVLALVVYVLRRRLAETAAFENQAHDRPKSGAGALWKAHPREFVLVAIISAGGSLAFYAYTTYMQKFLANTAGFPIQTATGIMTAALVVFMLVQPLFGAISDRVGRKPMLLIFGIGGMLVSVPVFSALEDVGTPGAAFRDRAGAAAAARRLHLDRRAHQGRAVPGAHPRARRVAALRDRQRDVRRHRRICRTCASSKRMSKAASTGMSRSCWRSPPCVSCCCPKPGGRA